MGGGAFVGGCTYGKFKTKKARIDSSQLEPEALSSSSSPALPEPAQVDQPKSLSKRVKATSENKQRSLSRLLSFAFLAPLVGAFLNAEFRDLLGQSHFAEGIGYALGFHGIYSIISLILVIIFICFGKYTGAYSSVYLMTVISALSSFAFAGLQMQEEKPRNVTGIPSPTAGGNTLKPFGTGTYGYKPSPLPRVVLKEVEPLDLLTEDEVECLSSTATDAVKVINFAGDTSIDEKFVDSLLKTVNVDRVVNSLRALDWNGFILRLSKYPSGFPCTIDGVRYLIFNDRTGLRVREYQKSVAELEASQKLKLKEINLKLEYMKKLGRVRIDSIEFRRVGVDQALKIFREKVELVDSSVLSHVQITRELGAYGYISLPDATKDIVLNSEIKGASALSVLSYIAYEYNFRLNVTPNYIRLYY